MISYLHKTICHFSETVGRLRLHAWATRCILSGLSKVLRSGPTLQVYSGLTLNPGPVAFCTCKEPRLFESGACRPCTPFLTCFVLTLHPIRVFGILIHSIIFFKSKTILCYIVEFTNPLQRLKHDSFRFLKVQNVLDLDQL